MRIEMKSKKVFVGISHIGFTENEDEKRTLNAEGQLVNVPKRPKLVTASRKQTALKILRQIKRKKHNQVHSFTGNIAYKINLFFPSLVETIFQINFNETTQKRMIESDNLIREKRNISGTLKNYFDSGNSFK
jgi:hypothetical protein